MKKSQYYRKPYRIRRKKSILKSRFFWFGILFLMILGGIFYFGFFSPFFQVSEIKISGNHKVSAQDLENLIRDQIPKKLIFFSTKSIFLADLNEIKETVLLNFPYIAKITLKRDWPHGLSLNLEEKKAVALFYENSISTSSEKVLSNQADYFLVDEEGIIFDKLPEYLAGLNPALAGIIKISSQAEYFNLREKIIEKEILDKILTINKELKSGFKIPIEEFFLASDTKLNIKTKESWQIYFDLLGDIDWQLTKLKTVLNEKVLPEKRQDLEYIDLRFSKVYLKYR